MYAPYLVCVRSAAAAGSLQPSGSRHSRTDERKGLQCQILVRETYNERIRPTDHPQQPQISGDRLDCRLPLETSEASSYRRLGESFPSGPAPSAGLSKHRSKLNQ